MTSGKKESNCERSEIRQGYLLGRMQGRDFEISFSADLIF